MDKVFLSKIFQSLKDLDCKSPNETEWNSLEIIILNELIKIDWEKLKRDDQVLSKHTIIFDSNNIVGVIWVIFFQM